MAETITKIGIRRVSTNYDIRDIGVKAQNVVIGRDGDGNVIPDVNADSDSLAKKQPLAEEIIELEKEATKTQFGRTKYGNTEGTACEGDDSRLSDARENPNPIVFLDGTAYDGSSEVDNVDYTAVGAAPIEHVTVEASGETLGHVKYGNTSGTACAGNDERLSDTREPKSHAVNTTKYGGGTDANYGHVKLSDIYNNENTTTGSVGSSASIAASAYALQKAYGDVYNLAGGTETITVQSVSKGGEFWIANVSGTKVLAASERGPIISLESAWNNTMTAAETKSLRKVYSYIAGSSLQSYGTSGYALTIYFIKDPTAYLPFDIVVKGVNK